VRAEATARQTIHPMKAGRASRCAGMAVNGALPPRVRELTILRTGWNCRSKYEFGQHADACISDDTWALLATHLDERQLIEVPVRIGQYHLVAYLINSFGIEREPELGGFKVNTGLPVDISMSAYRIHQSR
jgi:alkylhydroperoxidase family enzyme